MPLSVIVIPLTFSVYLLMVTASASELQPRSVLHYDAQSPDVAFSSAVLDHHTGMGIIGGENFTFESFGRYVSTRSTLYCASVTPLFSPDEGTDCVPKNLQSKLFPHRFRQQGYY